MTVAQTITHKITQAFAPAHLEVINQSHMHAVPPGSESHFKLVIVSDAFDGKRLVQRHMAVNGTLAAELKAGLHALSLETLTASEWAARGGQTLDSPPCHGGGKAEQG